MNITGMDLGGTDPLLQGLFAIAGAAAAAAVAMGRRWIGDRRAGAPPADGGAVSAVMGWCVTVAAALGLLHALLFFKIPADIYLNGSPGFAGGLAKLLLTETSFALVSFAITAPLAILAFYRWRRAAGVILVAAALGAWVLDSFLLRAYPGLDGTMLDFHPSTARTLLEAIIVIGALGLVALLGRFLLQPLVYFLAALAVLNIGWAFYAARQQGPASPPPEETAAHGIYALSADRNLLVFFMDGFQSDFMDDILKLRPDLHARLDGFIHFRDALSVAPTRVLGTPAAYSAARYDPLVLLGNQYADSVESGSVFHALAGKGYDVSIFDPVYGRCPSGLDCIADPALPRDTPEVHFGNAAWFLDLALLRMTPEPLKKFVYRNGIWLFSAHTATGGLTGDARAVYDDHALLQMLARNLKLERSDPVARVFHLKNTWLPYLLDADCAVRRWGIDNDRASAVAQAGCALEDLLAVVDALKREHTYNSTAIVVLAQRGVGDIDPWRKPAYEEGSPVAAANPVFLVKPLDSRGTLVTDERPASLSDLPRTVCATLADCTWERGWNLLDKNLAGARSRQYHHYAWMPRFWELERIPGLETYRVDGPVNRRESWKKTTTAERSVRVGSVTFSETDPDDVFGPGWWAVEYDNADSPKRFAVAESARLNLDLGQGADIRLDFTVYPPGSLAGQSMEVLVNGTSVGARQVHERLDILAYRVPADLLGPGKARVDLVFGKLRPPAGLEKRELALSFFNLDIRRLEPRGDAD